MATPESATPTGWPAVDPATDASSDARYRRLHAITLELCAILDVDALWERTLGEAVELLGADGGSLWIVDGGSLRCRLACGEDAAPVAGLTRDVGDREQLAIAPEGATAAAAVVQAGGAVRAVIRVQRELTTEPPFTSADRECLDALAASAAAALRIADRHAGDATRTRSLALVAQMSREITATLDLDRVLRAVVNLAARALTFDRGAVALYEDGKCDIRAVAGVDQIDPDDPKLADLAVRAGWAAGVKQSFYLSDREEPATDAERIFAQFFGADLEVDGMRSALYIPLNDEEGVVGILFFESTKTEFADEHQRELATILAHQATVAIRNARLYSQVPLADMLGALGQRRRAFLAMPRQRRTAYAVAAIAAVAALTLVRWPLRVGGDHPQLRAAQRAEVRPLVPGVIERMLVREGTVVARGDPLLQLRSAEARASRDAVIGDAQAAERMAALAASRGDAADEQMERRRAESLRQEAAVLDEQLRSTLVRTPVAGVVLTARPEERVGTRVEAGEPLLLVGRTDSLELELAVGQRDIGRVRLGDRVRLRVDALPQRTFTGTVVSVGALPVDSAGGSGFPVRAMIPNDAGLLLPGMVPYVRVLTAPESLAGRMVRAPLRWLRLISWRVMG